MNGKKFIEKYRNWQRNFSGLELKDIDFTEYPEFTKATNRLEEEVNQTNPLILTESKIKGCNAFGVNFQEIYAPRVDFSYSNLEKINFYNANLDEAIFHQANLRKANLRHTYLHGADFEGADISKAEIIQSYLEFTNLKKTIAIETLFRFSDLSNSSFDESTNLNKADFAWAFLTENYDLDKSNYKKAIFHQTMVLKDDLKKLKKLSKNKDSFIIMKDLKE